MSWAVGCNARGAQQEDTGASKGRRCVRHAAGAPQIAHRSGCTFSHAATHKSTAAAAARQNAALPWCRLRPCWKNGSCVFVQLGSEARAAAGELAVIAGGDAFERCRAVFKAMSTHQFHVAASGRAQHADPDQHGGHPKPL